MRELYRTSDTSARGGGDIRVVQSKGENEIQGKEQNRQAFDDVRECSRDLESGESARAHRRS
jgi:hypothetical protein